MAIDAAFWASAGFTAFFGVIALVAFLAYWSLRRMDDVVLRARMYMNRKRLFEGFLSVAIGMIAIFALVLAALAFAAAEFPMPSTCSLAPLFSSFAFTG